MTQRLSTVLNRSRWTRPGGIRTPIDIETPSLDILIISSYYWPETAGNAPYVTGVAEHLAEGGHRVTVATGFPHYPQWQSSAYGLLGIREVRRGVEIRRRRHYVPQTQSILTRAAYEASLCALGITALPKRAPDVIVGVSPTLAGAVLARSAASLYRRPYGIVFQDLQGPGALQSGVEGGRLIATLVERMEVTLARGAAGVGVIAEGFRDYFEQHGVTPGRIHRLRNWSQDAVVSETFAETRARLGWSDTDFVCLHAGNMGHKQGLENILRAAAIITDRDVRIVLAGDGNERARLQDLAMELGVSNVSFVPPQPTGLFEAMLRAADVLLVNQRSTVSEMSLASKLTSYFLAARPVVGAVAENSETARELERSSAGLLVRPDDPRELAAALAWVKQNSESAQELGVRGRSYAEAHLSAEKVLEGYEVFVRALSREHVTQASRITRNGRPWRAVDPRPMLIEARGPRPSAQKHTAVSCLIVSFECRRVLEECLESIDRERSTLPLEAIVVDNASRDGTVPAVVERFPWARVVANRENVGFARAANQAARLAEGDYLLFLNPDTVLPTDSISTLIGELERHADVGMLGCKLVRPDGTFDHACKRGFPTVSSALYYFFGLNRLRPSSPRFAHYTAGHLDDDGVGFVDAVNGAFMLVRRAAVEDVGPMDERYWLYAEDLDWCQRYWESGWKILYWPYVEVIHRKGGSTGNHRSWTLNRAFHRSMWLFYAKHHAPNYSRLFSAIVWVGVWVKFLMSAAASSVRRETPRLRTNR